MNQGQLNIMRREAERAMSRKAVPCYGVVTSYDPNTYSAKVRLQPSNQETGFLPIHSPWSGNGWGLFAPPSPGDLVEVNFQEDGKNAGMIGLRQFGNQIRPLPVPSGEFWVAHASGSSIRLTNDGRATVTDSSGASFVLNGDGTAILNASLIVNGQIQATEDIIDFYTTTGSTMANFRALYDAHRHDAPGGITSTPLAPDIL